MTELNLESGEYAITTLSDVSVNRSSNADVVLTNRNLFVVTKKGIKGIKSITRYGLDQITVINGRAQITIDKQYGFREATIQLRSGERLAITSVEDKDYESFGSQINLLLTGVPTAPQVVNSTAVGQISDAFQNVFSAFNPKELFGIGKTAPTQTQSRRASQMPQPVSRQCVGCHAPLSGYSGQVVTCGYCDTEQRL